MFRGLDPGPPYNGGRKWGGKEEGVWGRGVEEGLGRGRVGLGERGGFGKGGAGKGGGRERKGRVGIWGFGPPRKVMCAPLFAPN